MNKEIKEFNYEMENIIRTRYDKYKSYDYLIANYFNLIFYVNQI